MRFLNTSLEAILYINLLVVTNLLGFYHGILKLVHVSD